MGKMFNDLKEGFEAILSDDKVKLKKHTINILPLTDYKSSEIKTVRNNVGMTQEAFAHFLGVSKKTVEAWELGYNKPLGSSNRLITMLAADKNLVKKFPFVVEK